MSKITNEDPPLYSVSSRHNVKEKLQKLRQKADEDFNNYVITKYYEKFEEDALKKIDKLVDIIHKHNKIPDYINMKTTSFRDIYNLNFSNPSKMDIERYVKILCNKFNSKNLTDFKLRPIVYNCLIY